VPWAIIDSSVYIDHWERGAHQRALDEVRKAFIVRHSAVVLTELRRGARTRGAERLIETLFRLAQVQWEPTAGDWWEAGRLVRVIGDARGWDRGKRRDFQNDVLIGMTALRHGATLVTANRVDFELLAHEIPLSLLLVSEPAFRQASAVRGAALAAEAPARAVFGSAAEARHAVTSSPRPSRSPSPTRTAWPCAGRWPRGGEVVLGRLR